MCGIVGIASKNNISKNCYVALEKLEYRGYDSAGIAGLNGNKIQIFKKQGRVQCIKEFCDNANTKTAIAHTRWATHGKPCEENAHPIVSSTGECVIVHNGIIENYLEIKQNLEKCGVVFKTQTDTEVVCNLIEKETGNTLEKVKKACDKLTGSFALAVLFKGKNEIVIARKSSPIYVGSCFGGNMVASDILCFEKNAKYCALEDGEFAVVSKSKIQIYSSTLKKVKKSFKTIETSGEEIELCGFEFFMEKEINETPAVLKRIITEYQDKEKMQSAIKLFEGVKNVEIIACGTAYHAGRYGAKILQETLGLSASAHIASEFRYDKNNIKENTLAILVSQSGETADTLRAGELCKQNGYKVLAIINSMESSMSRLADVSLNIFAGKEIGVASTKAYSAMCLVFYILARYLKNSNFDTFEIEKLADQSKEVLKVDSKIVDLVKNASRVFFIGRQFDSISSLEGALKVKEISYKSAEGYPAGELKHGTLALINSGTPVFVLSTDKNMHDKTMAAAEEVRSRGGIIILISQNGFDKGCADFVINIPESERELAPLLSIIPLQTIAFETAKAIGNNPDKPRNLAKSVTVE